ncbi:MAG: DUF1810 domain-containing protein [Oscillospiraceae bacterium]|nr:DUF1810 domain-containing protein [Oscillospiraceae bacterium]
MIRDLERFTRAQEQDYARALSEIRSGRKRSHWMWYIFPQLAGLGMSSTSQFYAIDGLEEAAAYLLHPVLGPRLREISGALLDLDTDNPSAVFGWPDDLKLHSCMTLFHRAAPEEAVFPQVLDKYFGGREDSQTLRLLGL